MVRSRIGLAILSFAVLAAAAPAMAGQDFCIRRSIGGTFVLKDFKFPQPGECTLFSGYFGDTTPNALSGVACTASSGDFVTFGMTTYALGNRLFDSIRMGPLPAGTGDGTVLGLPFPTTQQGYDAFGGECPSPTPPVL
jgi:hypothetical protein